MSKAIALAVGMTGLFFPHNHRAGDPGIRAEITHVWSESCINISSTEGVDFEVTSVYVPPMGTPIVAICSGNYFLPDAFLEAAQSAGPDEQAEKAIVQAGADKAPRVTPADIEASILEEHFLVPGNVIPKDLPFGVGRHQSLNLLTICVLVLRNGFTVTGESACASPENFNEEIGRRIARENAVAKIWPLMGYELRTKLATG